MVFVTTGDGCHCSLWDEDTSSEWGWDDGLNTFQFIWEVMFTLLYAVCIFQKVFNQRLTASQGRHGGYLDISLGGGQREKAGSVPGSGGREMQCFPLPAMALGSRCLA